VKELGDHLLDHLRVWRVVVILFVFGAMEVMTEWGMSATQIIVVLFLPINGFLVVLTWKMGVENKSTDVDFHA